jgi:AICAR transformylase/IMP cyclohydrolase PurH
MKKAFAHTAGYDTAIAGFFALQEEEKISSTYNLH